MSMNIKLIRLNQRYNHLCLMIKYLIKLSLELKKALNIFLKNAKVMHKKVLIR